VITLSFLYLNQLVYFVLYFQIIQNDNLKIKNLSIISCESSWPDKKLKKQITKSSLSRQNLPF